MKHLWHQLQPQDFEYDAKSFAHHHLAISAILLLASSPLKLCQVGWEQAHIFRFIY